MKILKESKDNLPIEFITSFISRGWEEIGNTTESLTAIKEEFKGTNEVVEAIQDFLDAYLICIGRLEAHLGDKKYIEYPEEDKEEEVKESISRPVAHKAAPIAEKVTPAAQKPDTTLAESLKFGKAELMTPPHTLDEDYMAPKLTAKTADDYEFVCDFDDIDLSQPRVTDEDIYHQ